MFRLLLTALGSVMAMALVALMFAVPRAAAPSDKASLASSGSESAGELSESTGDETEIKRDSSGQFHLAAQVNGEDAEFLIDTGADIVAIGVEEAERLGVSFDSSTFEPITQTASGPGYGAIVQLDRFEVAGHRFDNVDAIVLDGLTINLLGQSLLRRMGKVELHGDTMTIGRGG